MLSKLDFITFLQYQYCKFLLFRVIYSFILLCKCFNYFFPQYIVVSCWTFEFSSLGLIKFYIILFFFSLRALPLPDMQENGCILKYMSFSVMPTAFCGGPQGSETCPSCSEVSGSSWTEHLSFTDQTTISKNKLEEKKSDLSRDGQHAASQNNTGTN